MAHRIVGDAVRTKDIADLSMEENSASEFSADYMVNQTKDAAQRSESVVLRSSKHLVKRRDMESGSAADHVRAKRDSKSRSSRSIKTAEFAEKAAIKTPSVSFKQEQVAADLLPKTARNAHQTEKAVRASMKKAAQSLKTAAKSLLKTIKGIISTTKSMVAAIAAGGSTAAVALVAICAVALLLGSAFGVFFSNETDGEKMREVVAELSAEYYGRVKEIEALVGHDRIEYDSNDGVDSLRWQDILSVYAVKLTANNSDGMEAVTINSEKKEMLSSLMWEMSELDYSTHTETIQVEVPTVDENGNEVTELQDTQITVLVIEITHRTPEDMAVKLGFSEEQNEQLALMREDQYATYWAALLGGYLAGNGEIIISGADWTATGPFSWPLPINGDFNSGFGYRNDPFSGIIKFHGGIDLGAATGTSILAADSGTVIVANATDPYYGYGYYVMIDHGTGFMTLYGHCSSVGVVTGQIVSKGEVIAAVGSTGDSTGPHLHFEVYQNGARVDPMSFFA